MKKIEKATNNKKIGSAEVRILIKNAVSIRENIPVKEFTTSAYVPVPIDWRGAQVTILKLKRD